jgi:hypothetical protein
VPCESSTGERVRRGSITKAGNTRVRRVLIEGAWTYRFPARVSRLLQERQEDLPQIVRAIAWKAQVRLCAVSAADGGRQAPDRGHHRDRAGDGGVPVGDRARDPTPLGCLRAATVMVPWRT